MHLVTRGVTFKGPDENRSLLMYATFFFFFFWCFSTCFDSLISCFPDGLLTVTLSLQTLFNMDVDESMRSAVGLGCS